MQNENKKAKIFELYKSTVFNIEKRIIKNILQNGGLSNIQEKEVVSNVCKMIQDYTKIFFDLKPHEREFENSDFLKIENVVREALLSLSGKTDLIPSESMVKYCCKQISTLMYITSNSINNDEE